MGKKPFQVIRINTKTPVGSRKQLLVELTKAKDHATRNKILQDVMYPNRLKSVDEEQ